MFLAGVSEQTGEQALKLWHLRNATSFNGCLKEVGAFLCLEKGVVFSHMCL